MYICKIKLENMGITINKLEIKIMDGVEALSEYLKLPIGEVITILEDGFYADSCRTLSGKMKNTYAELIDELKAEFDCY